MKRYICIDIGGTAIKYGLVSEEGVVLESSQIPTEAWKGGPGILEKTVKIAEEYISREQEQPGGLQGTEAMIGGICICTAGMVDVEKGEIFYAAPLIPNYAGTKFKETMERQFGIPCEVENDVNCAGLAEAVSGAAKGCKTMLMLTIGTGIGGCFVLNGEVYRGCSGSACEVGYMHLNDSDFQTLGAASILTKKVAERKGESEEVWDGQHIFEAARRGDSCCKNAIDEMVDILGKGIANICYVLNPEVVVLGGGIMAQKEYLGEKMESALKQWLLSSMACHTRIEFAKHQNQAGLLGAFYHYKRMHGEN